MFYWLDADFRFIAPVKSSNLQWNERNLDIGDYSVQINPKDFPKNAAYIYEGVQPVSEEAKILTGDIGKISKISRSVRAGNHTLQISGRFYQSLLEDVSIHPWGDSSIAEGYIPKDEEEAGAFGGYYYYSWTDDIAAVTADFLDTALSDYAAYFKEIAGKKLTYHVEHEKSSKTGNIRVPSNTSGTVWEVASSKLKEYGGFRIRSYLAGIDTGVYSPVFLVEQAARHEFYFDYSNCAIIDIDIDISNASIGAVARAVYKDGYGHFWGESGSKLFKKPSDVFDIVDTRTKVDITTTQYLGSQMIDYVLPKDCRDFCDDAMSKVADPGINGSITITPIDPYVCIKNNIQAGDLVYIRGIDGINGTQQVEVCEIRRVYKNGNLETQLTLNNLLKTNFQQYNSKHTSPFVY